MTSDLAGEAVSSTATVAFIVLGFVLIVAGSVGNILIVATILVNKSLRAVHNVFVVNLAVADFMVTTYFLPLQVTAFITGSYPVKDSSACQFVGFSIVWLFVASLLSIAAISINRYVKLCHDGSYHRIFTMTNTMLVCGAVWVLAFLCTFPPLAGWGRFHFDQKNRYCGFDRGGDLGYTLFLLCVSIAMPAALIVIFNAATYRHVLQSRRRVTGFIMDAKSRDRSTSGCGGPNSDPDQTQTNPSSSKTEEATTSQTQATTSQSVSNISEKPSSSKYSFLAVPGPSDVTSFTSNMNQNQDDVLAEGEDNKPTESRPSRKPQQSVTFNPKTSTGHALHDCSTAETSTRRGPKVTSRAELAYIKSVVVIFISFVVLMSPYMICALLDREKRWPAIVHIVCSYTSYAHCCVNCLVYGFMNRQFRNGYKNLMVRIRCWGTVAWRGRRQVAALRNPTMYLRGDRPVT